MLTLDQKVTLSCTDTGKDAAGTIVRIVGSRVDVMLDGGGDLLVSLSMQKPGLYVGSQSGPGLRPDIKSRFLHRQRHQKIAAAIEHNIHATADDPHDRACRVLAGVGA